ncbi:hypothetical protein PHYBLDRAFT_162960 [Phycomyces blakesleeanus NRRL 1555(-)]|uniref:Uncharacterized protein n=1 Tax=Phycomyces blakesleeanus (strain ATCC 8743b / DSM 1359 / FGSC 10004 / NBRC 33097 / NRRL 1555) TaxID=763407 RepID=A0A167QM35_PHYB8|nr:hypothetical protein PHYBLDRAFT_162960 [Phycomyces blakesleeanus NRRL 1555(-)]OAD79908.1 hypothetical protein PHYBLDRAFT_162960 [Phycomyces blakesleeanus NRRL 1555(-)]|eukprot:XP_018297948.1 hypothetical protein PHYBLDRAFT_162960 [Phycomyces blakesleeanus NRRL 1555(-)]
MDSYGPDRVILYQQKGHDLWFNRIKMSPTPGKVVYLKSAYRLSSQTVCKVSALSIKTTSSQPKNQTNDENNIKIYDYKTSVLLAFNVLQQPEKEQEKKLLITELGDLEPVVYVDREGEEHYLLAAPKGNIPQSSLPHTDTRYQNIGLCLIDNENSKKLVLGAKPVNVLLASSTRLKSNQLPIVGASSSNGFMPSRVTRVFIEKRKLKEIEIMMKANTQLDEIKSSNQHVLYPFDEHSQFRQLRSKLDRLSTYTCYRFSFKFTDDARKRPWTIWTIEYRSHT